jgi:hypothetical protein
MRVFGGRLGGSPTLTGSIPTSSNLALSFAVRPSGNRGGTVPRFVGRGVKSPGCNLSLPAMILLKIESGARRTIMG